MSRFGGNGHILGGNGHMQTRARTHTHTHKHTKTKTHARTIHTNKQITLKQLKKYLKKCNAMQSKTIKFRAKTIGKTPIEYTVFTHITYTNSLYILIFL
jgi:hypothetical protein